MNKNTTLNNLIQAGINAYVFGFLQSNHGKCCWGQNRKPGNKEHTKWLVANMDSVSKCLTCKFHCIQNNKETKHSNLILVKCSGLENIKNYFSS